MKTNDRIIHSVTLTLRGLPALAQSYGEKSVTFKAKAELHSLSGQKPYFSVTGTIWRGTGAYSDRNDIAGGCLHEEISKYFPKLRPLIALHLSDEDGQPTHGEANGFYWLAGALGGLGERYHGGSGDSGKNPDTCLRFFADHCRISIEEAQSIGRAVKEAFESGVATVAISDEVSERTKEEQAKAGRIAAKADWKVIYTDMLPRFKAEAEAGIELLRSLSTPSEPVAA